MGPDPNEVLRRRGLRVTAQRLAVLRAVAHTPHVTADRVVEMVRMELGSVSKQGVYNVLGALTEHGLLRRIEPPGSPVRYEGRVSDHHHHLICRDCRRIVDVDRAVGETLCLTAAGEHGQDSDEAEVIYWGRCPDCAAASPSGDKGRP